MSNIIRGIMRFRRWIFHLFCHATFILALLIGFWIITSQSVQAQECGPTPGEDNWALVFNGKFTYAGVEATQSFSAITIEAWVNFLDFSPRRKAIADVVRLAFAKLPDTGSTETSKLVADMYQLKDPYRWAFRICRTESDCTAFEAALQAPQVDDWYFLAATWKVDTVNPLLGRIDLYQDGVRVGGGTTHIVDVPDVLFTRIGRGNSALKAQLGETAVWRVARSAEQIKSDYECGIAVNQNEMFFYLPFDVGGSQVLYDRSCNGNDGILGATNGVDRKTDPAYEVASYSRDSTDTDGDGFPDGCDNCPNDYNPKQYNLDDDAYGDECDSCPKDDDEQGLADTCSNVLETIPKVNGNLAEACFTYSLPPNYSGGDYIYFVKHDCFNTLFDCADENGRLNQIDRHRTAYGIPAAAEVVEYPNDPTKGDVIKVNKNDLPVDICVTCDLLKFFYPSTLKSAKGTLTCTATYQSYIYDPDPDPNTFVDLWMGAATSEPFSVQYVNIDVKPGSDPSSININAGGVVPFAINGSDEFDPSDPEAGVDPTSVLLGVAPTDLTNGCPATQWSFKDWQPDGYQDIVLHCETSCLRDDADVTTATTELTLIGTLVDGTSIMGKDDTVKVND